jgi:hypothetical protein
MVGRQYTNFVCRGKDGACVSLLPPDGASPGEAARHRSWNQSHVWPVAFPPGEGGLVSS